jgi:flagellar biosynthesis protein FlhA
MDGASKFVRGDAIAGIVIMLINIIGGMIIGMAQHDMDFGDGGQELHAADHRRRSGCADSRLIISIAAGMVVTRVSDDRDIGQQVHRPDVQ